jgi:hypothetical protein
VKSVEDQHHVMERTNNFLVHVWNKIVGACGISTWYVSDDTVEAQKTSR